MGMSLQKQMELAHKNIEDRDSFILSIQHKIKNEGYTFIEIVEEHYNDPNVDLETKKILNAAKFVANELEKGFVKLNRAREHSSIEVVSELKEILETSENFDDMLVSMRNTVTNAKKHSPIWTTAARYLGSLCHNGLMFNIDKYIELREDILRR